MAPYISQDKYCKLQIFELHPAIFFSSRLHLVRWRQ